MNDNGQQDGGIGGQPVVDTRTGGKDMRLIRRAIQGGWPITDEIRELVIREMGIIVRDSENERNRVAAAKTLVSADGINARLEVADIGNDTKQVDVNIIDWTALKRPVKVVHPVEEKIQQALSSTNGHANGKP